MIKRRVIQGLKVLVATVAFGTLILKQVYRTQMEGVVELPNAPGLATITREEETQIAHIEGESLNAAFYAQGYAHA